MNLRASAFLLSLLLLCTSSSVQALGRTTTELDILTLVNRERERRRLGELSWNEDLARVARAYSRRMGREGFFEHEDPDGNTVVERAEKARLGSWQNIGENLFVGDDVYNFARFAVRGWMGSSSHRENMLDGKWRATGIGIAKGTDGMMYVTQIFVD